MRYYKKLVGKSVYLSPININDYEIYCKWLNNLSVSVPIGLASASIPIESEKEALSSLAKGHNYAIVTLSNNELLGNCSLADVNHLHNTATLGIFIGEECNRGMGYGKEAIELILSYGFNILNLKNIMLKVYSFNDIGIAAYKKLGFKQFGKRSESYTYNGVCYDTIYMEILSKDFKSSLLKL